MIVRDSPILCGAGCEGKRGGDGLSRADFLAEPSMAVLAGKGSGGDRGRKVRLRDYGAPIGLCRRKGRTHLVLTMTLQTSHANGGRRKKGGYGTEEGEGFRKRGEGTT